MFVLTRDGEIYALFSKKVAKKLDHGVKQTVIKLQRPDNVSRFTKIQASGVPAKEGKNVVYKDANPCILHIQGESAQGKTAWMYLEYKEDLNVKFCEVSKTNDGMTPKFVSTFRDEAGVDETGQVWIRTMEHDNPRIQKSSMIDVNGGTKAESIKCCGRIMAVMA